MHNKHDAKIETDDAPHIPVTLCLLKTLVANRLEVLAQYSRHVILPIWREECRRAEITGQNILKYTRKFLVQNTESISPLAHQQLTGILEKHIALQTVYQYKLKFQAIWAKSAASQKEILASVQNWCIQAELTGITVLREFVQYLKGGIPQKACEAES